jgi:hypothetical protein
LWSSWKNVNPFWMKYMYENFFSNIVISFTWNWNYCSATIVEDILIQENAEATWTIWQHFNKLFRHISCCKMFLVINAKVLLWEPVMLRKR